MTVTSTTGSLRAFVARHPVPSMITMMLTGSFALLIPPALAGWALEPFLLATVILAQLVPAVLVTAATDGRAGVRELFRRTLRWRVPLVWYAVSFLVLPVAALLASAAMFGSTAGLDALLTDPAVIGAYLGQLAILPLINLWEETAVTGVIQARLIATRGQAVNGAHESDLALLDELCDTMFNGSLCGLGGMTPFPVRSALKHFREDFG